MKFLALTALILITSSCGNGRIGETKNNTEAPPQKKTIESLSGKSDEEILKLKYDNRLQVVCEARVQKGETIDLQVPPTATVSWEILTGVTEQKRELNYSEAGKDFKLVLTRKNLVVLDHINYKDSEGNEYYFENSPEVELSFEHSMNEGIGGSRGKGTIKLNEKIWFEPVKVTMSSSNHEQLTHLIRCILNTQVMAGYENEWTKIK